MSTELIIGIAIVVLVLVALLVLLQRMRAKAEERKATKELESRRERVATEHREEAGARSTSAEESERKAAIAHQNAKTERAQAERLEQEAQLHERGLADDKLIDDHERDRFEGVTGTAHGDDDNRPAATRSGSGDASANAANERGLEDERTTGQSGHAERSEDGEPAPERDTRR
jgi:type II secretory pathway pseudopilin PulG